MTGGRGSPRSILPQSDSEGIRCQPPPDKGLRIPDRLCSGMWGQSRIPEASPDYPEESPGAKDPVQSVPQVRRSREPR